MLLEAIAVKTLLGVHKGLAAVSNGLFKLETKGIDHIVRDIERKQQKAAEKAAGQPSTQTE